MWCDRGAQRLKRAAASGVMQPPAGCCARACDGERAASCVGPVRGGGGVAVAKLAVWDVAQLTARYVAGAGDRREGHVRGVVGGFRGRGAGGMGG